MFNIGDRVTISNNAIVLFGVKPGVQEFMVKNVFPDGVVELTNDWKINERHLKIIEEPTRFNFDEAVDEILAELIDYDRAFTPSDVFDSIIESNPDMEFGPNDLEKVEDLVEVGMKEVPSYKIHFVNEHSFYYMEEYDPATYVVGDGIQTLAFEPTIQPENKMSMLSRFFNMFRKKV